jgi:hypothetical protein
MKGFESAAGLLPRQQAKKPKKMVELWFRFINVLTSFIGAINPTTSTAEINIHNV